MHLSLRRYCAQLGLREVDELTHEGAGRFKTWCTGTRRGEEGYIGNAGSSLRALRRVCEVKGVQVPPWQSVKRRSRPPGRLVRLRHASCSASRLPGSHGPQEAGPHRQVLDHLTASGKSWRQMRLPDIDAFLIQ